MKRMRYSAVLVVLALIAFGCGDDDTETAEDASAASETTAAEAAETTAAAPAEPLQIVGPWRATEADAFNLVLDGFRDRGYEVQYEGVEDVLGTISPRIAAGSPPDLAVLPVAAGLKDLARQEGLVAIDSLKSEMEAAFVQGWLDLMTVDGTLYGVPTRADITSLLWYNPATLGAAAPTSWEEFTAICDGVGEGEFCTGGIALDTWTLANLFENAYLSVNGPDMYTKLVTGEIPFTDASVVDALNRILVYYGDDYTAGGRIGALGTGLVDGTALVFGTSANSKFVSAGSWLAGVALDAVNAELVEGETIDYVTFPSDPVGQGVVVAVTDTVVVLSDTNPAALELASYLASAESQVLFTHNGYTVANKNVDTSAFSGLTAQTAGLLADSEVVIGTGAMLSAELRGQMIETVAAVILEPDNMTSLLETLQLSADEFFGG